MTRGLDGATGTALQQPHVIKLLLIELGFDSGTQYLTSAEHAVDWGGHTYLAANGIGTIEPITETALEARGLTFTLSAVTESAVAGAITEPVQGRPVVLRLGIVDAGTLRVDPNMWTGTFDQMVIDDSADAPVIRVTVESELIAWLQASGLLFSDQEQQERHPGDLFFQSAAAMAEATITWPNKIFFQR